LNKNKDLEDSELFQALRDLAAGRGVSRGRHSLIWEGRDLTGRFVEALVSEGFEPMTVKQAPVDLNEKAPAFRVQAGQADFGWVFWEAFTERRARKLFGSEVRARSGDWEVQLGAGSRERLYVKVSDKVPVDPERPFSGA
jgi:hypothetical protein